MGQNEISNNGTWQGMVERITMNSKEFFEWFEHHSAAFPSIPGWIEKFPNADAVWGRWQAAMVSVSLEASKSATDMIADGQEPTPKGFTNHPIAVVKIAKRIESARQTGPKYIDGILTISCNVCGDLGVVFVIKPKFVQAALEGDFGARVMRQTRQCVVACSCEAGIPKQQQSTKATGMVPGLPEYDEQTMIIDDPMWNHQEAIAVINERRKS